MWCVINRIYITTDRFTFVDLLLVDRESVPRTAENNPTRGKYEWTPPSVGRFVWRSDDQYVLRIRTQSAEKWLVNHSTQVRANACGVISRAMEDWTK